MEGLDRAFPPPLIRLDPASGGALLGVAAQIAIVFVISMGFGGHTPLDTFHRAHGAWRAVQQTGPIP